MPEHHVHSRYCAKAALTHQLQPGGASDAEVTYSLRVNKEVFLPEANDNDHDCQSRSSTTDPFYRKYTGYNFYLFGVATLSKAACIQCTETHPNIAIRHMKVLLLLKLFF